MNPYVVSGTTIPTMLGRDRIFDRICRGLSKDTPDRISVIGPKLYGKTVVLNQVAKHFASGQPNYLTSTYIDLRHPTVPQNEAEFLARLSDHVRAAVAPHNSELGEILADSDGDTRYDNLKLVFENLESTNRLLLVFDAFDALAIGAEAETGIGPNLLDQLRELASLPSFSLVIGSRRRLRELCKTEEVAGSDFWRLFAEPITVGKFDDNDWEPVLAPFGARNISFEAGAETELKNWSGGVPVLAARLLDRQFEDAADGATVSRDAVVESARDLVHSDVVADLWDDCDGELKSQLAEGDVQQARQHEVRTRGFDNCRIITDFASTQSVGLQGMTRLFGTEDRFNANIKRMLELRHDQVVSIDASLRRYVGYAIRDLADEPNKVLDSARGIIEEAVRVVWTHESIEGETNFPADWRDYWVTTCGLDLPDRLDPLPSDRGLQVRLLRHVAGCTQTFPRVPGVTVSRQTVSLLEQVGSCGNFRNHRQSEDTRFGVACAMCLTAIELMASLAADYGAPT